MPINNLTHFVLIDFENVPGVDLGVLGRHPMAVTLFLGPKSKLKAGLVEQITSLPFEVRLIKVGLMKKNALDFVLAYHLGEMVPRYPRGHYYIVSKDQDFEPLITHLRDHNLHITQHADLASLPFLAQPQLVMPVAKSASPAPAAIAKPVAPVVKAEVARIAVAKPAAPIVKIAPTAPVVKPVTPKKPAVPRETKIIASLKDSTKLNRPSTLKSLQAHIKNSFGKEATPEKVAALISKLRKAQILAVDVAGHVTYK